MVDYAGQGKLREERHGDWMSTFLGGRFYPFDPRPEDFNVLEIGTALSRICRFGGHCAHFYSVAQHSILVSEILPEELALWGLFHDAAEAYMGDIVRPLKRMLNTLTSGRVSSSERFILEKLAEAFHLPWPMSAEVKRADNIALMTEARDLMSHSQPLEKWPWPDGLEPLPERIEAVGPDQARALWLGRYEQIATSRHS